MDKAKEVELEKQSSDPTPIESEEALAQVAGGNSDKGSGGDPA